LEVTFTRHAREKFDLLSSFGFAVTEDQVIGVVMAPDKAEKRGDQTFSMKTIDDDLALRVVHEERKGIIVVITFYPVKRERYDL
jgi:hypothetical protein